jgi:hypothetical protein
MTEEEWLDCTDPALMLEFLRGKVSDRKLRLFACACCRRIWRLLEDARSREAVEVSERFADGMAGEAEVQVTEEGAEEAAEAIPDGTSDSRLAAGAASCAIRLPAKQDAWNQIRLAQHVALGVRLLLHLLPGGDEFLAHCNLLRCLFGNPFRPVTLKPAWQTPTVASLAHAAYEERILPSGHLDNARLGILADAFEEAGCTDSSILDHLRSPGPHVRGCHVVDLLTGRK